MNHNAPKREKKIVFSNSDYLDYAGFERRKPKQRPSALTVILRVLVALMILLGAASVGMIVYAKVTGDPRAVAKILRDGADVIFQFLSSKGVIK